MRERTDPGVTSRGSDSGIHLIGTSERPAFRGVVDGLSRLRDAVRRLVRAVPADGGSMPDDDAPS